MSIMQLYDRNFNYLYKFDDYEKLLINLKFYGKNTLALQVNTSHGAAHFLKPDNYITCEHNGTVYPFVIKAISFDNAALTVQAVSPHELLERRITIPPSGNYSLDKTGAVDKVIKDYITACTNTTTRALPITLAATRTGSYITETSRYKNLGEEIERICDTNLVGESWTLDSANKRFVFDTYTGVDRTPGNTADNPPCVFAEKYHNLNAFAYNYDTSGIITTPIVAGAGEGVEREILTVGNAKQGLERYETFVDARDVEAGNTDLLLERGFAKIANPVESVSTEEVESSNLVFGEDYNLGDLVAVRFSSPLISLTVAIMI